MERVLFIDYAKFSTYNENNLNFKTKDNEKQNVDTSKSFTECLINMYMEQSNIKNFLDEENLKNIRYNPNLNHKQTLELKGSTHDGTLLFVEENCLTALNALYNYYYDNKDKLDYIEFGDIEIKSDYGTKDINGMNIQGQTDVIKIPVEIILK